MNQIDRVTGGHDADEIAGESDMGFAYLAADRVEPAQYQAFRLFDARSRRGAQPDAHDRRVGLGEDFGRRAGEQDVDQAACRDHIQQCQRRPDA
jgi:hypothetical protein